MNDLLQEFWRACDEVADRVVAALDEAAFSLEIALDEAMVDLLELAEPLVASCEVVGESVTQSVQPIADGHSACVGCRHYHGQVYGETMLVCAMYPYGPEAPSCKDWASTWEHLGNHFRSSQ
ncbi:hypothetical protein [Leptolyngbya sp. FACHB-261]|uniref:hypothetical protein n=1 Tax=Leptolyngbya sp. FACHB-261 TaxID=2692806 RepID=UPI001685E022|nr:hypothetical protein [Leptolyngbya sp. FACHB-261]MBD2099923.1 hypothetical protein [Leptolyngbya sp. FACHB-261]